MNPTVATRPQSAKRHFRRLRRFRFGDDGVSAVEFALFAPMLLISLLAMVDIGFAIYERMTIDHVLRAGAQEAMSNQGKSRVLAVLNATAAKSFPPADMPVFKVNHLYDPRCECPNSHGVPVACATTCPGPSATSIFYDLEGEKTYKGIFISIDLASSVEVQVR
jgi:pilus assembly protein CpaE